MNAVAKDPTYVERMAVIEQIQACMVADSDGFHDIFGGEAMTRARFSGGGAMAPQSQHTIGAEKSHPRRVVRQSRRFGQVEVFSRDRGNNEVANKSFSTNRSGGLEENNNIDTKKAEEEVSKSEPPNNIDRGPSSETSSGRKTVGRKTVLPPRVQENNISSTVEVEEDASKTSAEKKSVFPSDEGPDAGLAAAGVGTRWDPLMAWRKGSSGEDSSFERSAEFLENDHAGFLDLVRVLPV